MTGFQFLNLLIICEVKIRFTEHLATSAISLLPLEYLAITSTLGYLPLAFDLLIFTWVDDGGHTVIYPGFVVYLAS